MIAYRTVPDAGQEEGDAGKKLLAVVVLGALRRHLSNERVFRGVERRPLTGEGREKHGPIRLGPSGRSRPSVQRAIPYGVYDLASRLWRQVAAHFAAGIRIASIPMLDVTVSHARKTAR